jgi:hypothetical protein
MPENHSFFRRIAIVQMAVLSLALIAAAQNEANS